MEESKKEIYGFEELKSRFPDLRQEDIPQGVIDAVGEDGNLAIEYLAYENRRLSEINTELINRAAAAEASLGNQQNPDEGNTPLSEEFIRSLWGK